MNINEKITAWEPGAVWSEAGDGMFTVPVEKFHALAARLRAEYSNAGLKSVPPRP